MTIEQVNAIARDFAAETPGCFVIEGPGGLELHTPNTAVSFLFQERVLRYLRGRAMAARMYALTPTP